MTSYLDITLGPMFSGKTSKLINIYNELKNTENIIVINHQLDTRYHNTTPNSCFSNLYSHDKISVPSLMIDNLFNSWFDHNEPCYNIINSADYILINEAQFFDELKYVVLDMLRNNKKVFIFGLDGDFEQKKFGEILDLIPYSDNIEKLNSICSNCNGKAIFSHRIEKNSDQVLIGNNNYLPLCRNCFYKEKNSLVCEKIPNVD